MARAVGAEKEDASLRSLVFASAEAEGKLAAQFEVAATKQRSCNVGDLSVDVA